MVIYLCRKITHKDSLWKSTPQSFVTDIGKKSLDSHCYCLIVYFSPWPCLCEKTSPWRRVTMLFFTQILFWLPWGERRNWFYWHQNWCKSWDSLMSAQSLLAHLLVEECNCHLIATSELHLTSGCRKLFLISRSWNSNNCAPGFIRVNFCSFCSVLHFLLQRRGGQQRWHQLAAVWLPCVGNEYKKRRWGVERIESGAVGWQVWDEWWQLAAKAPREKSELTHHRLGFFFFFFLDLAPCKIKNKKH